MKPTLSGQVEKRNNFLAKINVDSLASGLYPHYMFKKVKHYFRWLSLHCTRDHHYTIDSATMLCHLSNQKGFWCKVSSCEHCYSGFVLLYKDDIR